MPIEERRERPARFLLFLRVVGIARDVTTIRTKRRLELGPHPDHVRGRQDMQ
jgi:hypothetical protein